MTPEEKIIAQNAEIIKQNAQILKENKSLKRYIIRLLAGKGIHAPKEPKKKVEFNAEDFRKSLYKHIKS